VSDATEPATDVDNVEEVDEVTPAPVMYGVPLTDSFGQAVVHPSRDEYARVLREAADDGFTVAVDVTAVDYLEFDGRTLPDGVPAERFEVVVNLLDIGQRRRLRVRVQVPEGEPVVPSLFDLHPGTEAFEREVYDMFGIEFSDHPDLTRILMPEDWEGHPLRKDYAVGEIPVQFKHVGAR